jgi:predicted MFS family arabinose efflux permease
VLLVAITTFFVGSVVCATSSSAARLVGGRAGQGTAVGGLPCWSIYVLANCLA